MTVQSYDDIEQMTVTMVLGVLAVLALLGSFSLDAWQLTYNWLQHLTVA